MEIYYIFDFDLTISDIHSNGNYNKKYNYITNETYNNFCNILNIIKKTDNKAFILTRGIKYLLEEYLKEKYTNIYNNIEYIYGALNEDDVKEKYPNEWAVKKADTIEYLYKNKTPYIVFFDDTIENINEVNNRKMNLKTIHVTNKNDIYNYFYKEYFSIPKHLSEKYDYSITNAIKNKVNEYCIIYSKRLNQYYINSFTNLNIFNELPVFSNKQNNIYKYLYFDGIDLYINLPDDKLYKI